MAFGHRDNGATPCLAMPNVTYGGFGRGVMINSGEKLAVGSILFELGFGYNPRRINNSYKAKFDVLREL